MSFYQKPENHSMDNFYQKSETAPNPSRGMYQKPEPHSVAHRKILPQETPKQSPLEKKYGVTRKYKVSELSPMERKMIKDEAYRRLMAGIPLEENDLVEYGTSRTRRKGMSSGMGSRGMMYNPSMPMPLQPK